MDSKMRYFTIAILAFSINAFAQFPTNETVGYLPGSKGSDALSADPFAQPDNICTGQTIQLFALPSGGSNNYSYTWTSDPRGFTSNSPDPVVTPLVTTKFMVEINDGYDIVTGDVTVLVNSLPNINLIPENDQKIRIVSPTEIGVCAFDSVTIDAGNPGSTYLWSDGSSDRTISAQTSGISFDIQEYEVIVTNLATGCSNSSNITINFTFNDCSYGVEEKNQAEAVKIYPNPSSDGLFNYVFEPFKGEITIEVFTSRGAMVKREVISQNQESLYTSTIDLCNQTRGVYFLKAFNNEVVLLRKLIIQ